MTDPTSKSPSWCGVPERHERLCAASQENPSGLGTTIRHDTLSAPRRIEEGRGPMASRRSLRKTLSRRLSRVDYQSAVLVEARASRRRILGEQDPAALDGSESLQGERGVFSGPARSRPPDCGTWKPRVVRARTTRARRKSNTLQAVYPGKLRPMWA